MVKTRQDTFWMNPVPLWADGLEKTALPGQASSNPPMILRFVTDWFMDEFNQILATDPSRIAEYRVQQETWRGFSRPALPQKETDLLTTTLRRFGIEHPFTRPTKTAVVSGKVTTDPLKLYQPAHQRFYLVTSSLISDKERLPDHPVNPGNHERVGFVIRRIWPPVKTLPNENLGFPDSTWKEYAFNLLPDGSYAWNQVPEGDYGKLQNNEELLPMFPVNYSSECVIHGRRLWAGLIPVGKREAYMGAMAVTAPTLTSSPLTPETARKVLFRTLVSEPWKSLVDTAAACYTAYRESLLSSTEENPVTDDDINVRVKQTRELIQTTSWLILADFRKFLMDYNNTVWKQIEANTPSKDWADRDPKNVLYNLLNTLKLNENLATRLTSDMGKGTPKATAGTLADALRQLNQNVINEMERSYKNFEIGQENRKYPPFLFPLVDPDILYSPKPVFNDEIPVDDDSNDDFLVNNTADDENIESNTDQNNEELIPLITLAILDSEPENDSDIDLETFTTDFKKNIDKLAAVVIRALDKDYTAGEPQIPLAAMLPADLREGWFKIRCVYERPLCPVHCDPEIVSEPSEPFQMAGFFDPDAPARPIRIGLPIDTTASGLRKFNKNTAFVISDILCGQIKRFKKITFGNIVLSVLPWPFHKDLPSGSGGPCKKNGLNMGTICSLSIPIITLCAIILLIIMVALFDYIFKWLPFFCLCFPIPGFKAKK